MSSDSIEGRPAWPILVAPVLVVVAIALLRISDQLLVIGPFDRATFAWAFPVPMLLVAPAVAGLLGIRTDRRRGWIAVVAESLGVGVFITAVLVVTIDRIGCAVATPKIEVLGGAAPVGLLAGVGFALGAVVANRLRHRPVVAAMTAISVTVAIW